MPTRFLSDAELAQLAGFPADVAGEDLVTYFSLEGDDLRWVAREHRGQPNRLGVAVQRPVRAQPGVPPRGLQCLG